MISSAMARRRGRWWCPVSSRWRPASFSGTAPRSPFSPPVLLLERLLAGFHDRGRAAWPVLAQWLEALALRLVVRDEKVLDVGAEVVAEVVERLQVFVVARLARDGDQAVVARGRAVAL